MSHFSAIGFDIQTEEDISRLVDEILDVAIEHSVHEHLTYLRYTDPSGAEIWLCGNNESQKIVGCTPCFLPIQTQNFGIMKMMPIQQGQYGDGSTYGWLNAEYFDDDMDGTYPLFIDLPDYLNHQNKQHNQKAYLTLFAEDVSLYVDEDEFYQSKEQDKLSPAKECFFPMGTFTDDNSYDAMNAQVLVGGTVLKGELRTNQLTKNQFYWCLIQTYGSHYEAVYPFDMFDKVPEVGNIVFGKYWLTGRFE